jgi:hypothetical protein
LLTEVHTTAEKAKTQGVNDFIVFSVVAVTALTSGWLHHRYGWVVINLAVVIPVFFVLVATLWLKLHRSGRIRPRPATPGG